jgi:hypothetical protein
MLTADDGNPDRVAAALLDRLLADGVLEQKVS